MITVSEEENVTVFIDTNVFIQLKDIQDLPWRNLFPNLKELKVMICSRIIEELDGFKNGPSQRRRNRSRAALKTIKIAARSTGRQIALREEPFKVILKLNDPQNLNWEEHTRLDASRPDDHLVLEALTHGSDAIVFSHDTGPFVQALALGVKAAEPEEEGWFLPHEPSAKEQKVRRLERELEQIKSTCPQIDVSFDIGEDALENITLLIPILAPLETHLVEKLTRAYTQLNPRHDIVIQPSYGMLGLTALGDRLTQSDKDEYLKKYIQFESDTYKFFQNLHKKIERVSLAHSISYRVKNVSQVAAKGLRIDASIGEPFYLLADEEGADENVGGLFFPSPPEKPVPRIFKNMEGLSLSAALHRRQKPRDPVKFYWEMRPKNESTKSALQCEDFRATEIFNDEVWICALNDQDTIGQLILKISATNLRQPKSAIIKFNFKKEEMEWTDTRFHERLPEPLGEILLSQLS